MTNKNKGKVIQMLSPENYIRKKARSLPIHECWITENWEDSGMANIVVSRSHTNGNITFCFYLVDLLCLGVKDSSYKFNVTETEFRDFIERMAERMPVEIIDYVLAHNIILSAVEFAEEYGFKPHKDFTSVTEFMLEEDNDDIELIEIECGRNGKPLYVQGPYDSEATANKIMKQLEHLAGQGNFDFIQEVGSDFDDEFEDDLEDNDDWNEDDDLDADDDDDWEEVKSNQLGNEMFPLFSHEEIEKSNKIIAELAPRLNDLKSKEIKRLAEAISVVSASLCETDEVRKATQYFESEFGKVEITDEIPDEMMGIENLNLPNREKIKDIFLKGYQLDGKKLKKTIAKLHEEAGVIAGVDILELMYLEPKDNEEFLEKLKQSYSDFPNNPIIKISYLIEKLLGDKPINNMKPVKTELQDIFGNRRTVNKGEWYFYLLLLLFNLSTENNPSKIFSFIIIMNKQDLYEDDLDDLQHTAMLIQIDTTMKKLKIK